MSTRFATLLDGVLARDTVAVARAISVVDRREIGYEGLADSVWRHGGHARVIGVTGAPGSGKSTLTSALVSALRNRGRTVGIIAVDPSSTLSGGSILGDRIRMSALIGDEGVFTRSLASGGSLGGLSRATVDAVAVLDAARFDDVIVETVGVGQAEADIVRIAHTVLVVSVPGLGDDVQMIKAGLLEVADIHVVNKADRPDADRLVAEIKSMLTMGVAMDPSRFVPEIVETVATEGRGVEQLADAIDRHLAGLVLSGAYGLRVRQGCEARLREIAKELLMESVGASSDGGDFDATVDDVASRSISPHLAARRLLSGLPRHMERMEVST